MRNNNAGTEIPCKPQKLQEILATVKIRGIWRKVGQAGRKTWLPCHRAIVEQSWIGRKNGRWQGGAAGPHAWQQRGTATVQPGCSGCVVVTRRIRLSGWNERDQAEWLG